MGNGVTTAWAVSEVRWVAEELRDKGRNDMGHQGEDRHVDRYANSGWPRLMEEWGLRRH